MSPELPAGLNWLLVHSWQAGVLVLLVLLVQRIFRRQLTNRWRFALWWIVLLRLVLPFGPASALSLFNVIHPAVRLPAPAVLKAPPVQTDSGEGLLFPNSADGHAEPLFADPPQPVLTDDRQALPSLVGSERAVAWTCWVIPTLAGVWLAGVLALFGVVGFQCLRFYQRLALASTPAGDSLQNLLRECRREFPVGRAIELLETDAVQSPALFGLFRLRLLLPRGIDGQFGNAELRYIFLHELAHVKRGDLWLNWLVTLLQILHWFNPLLWFGFARLRADRELACDELALLRAGDRAGTAYGETVVKLLEKLSRPTAIPGLVGILEDRRQMRRRITMIANFRRPGRWSVLAVLLVAALAIAALTDAQSEKPEASRINTEGDGMQNLSDTQTSRSLFDGFMPVNQPPHLNVEIEGTSDSTNLKTGRAAASEGGTGRMVIGRLEPGRYYIPVITNFSQCSLQLESTDPIFQASVAQLNPDGSFTAKDVLPGEYGLALTKPGNWGPTNWVNIYNTYQKLTVPPIQDDPENSVVDWGEVWMSSAKFLIAGEVRGTVLTPDGTPAAGAEVALQLKNKMLSLGKEGFEPDLREDGLLFNAGLDGSFTLPMYAGAESVIARSAQGFAQVSLEQLRRSPQITLQKWGRIEGTFQLRHHPCTNELMAVAVRRGWSSPHSSKADENAGDPAAANGGLIELESPDVLSESLQSRTDDQGHFVITNVPPGQQTLCWEALFDVNSWNYRTLVVVDVQPGATTVTNVGGNGRTIIGRVKFSDGQPSDWISGTVDLMSPSPESRERRKHLKTDAERHAFDQSPAVQASWNNPRNYTTTVQPDGSFRADEVESGQYGFVCNVHTRRNDSPYPASVNYFPSQEVVIPAAKGDNDESIVDLGEVEVARLQIPKPTPAINPLSSQTPSSY